MKKFSLSYWGKTGIAESKGFQKKGLAELACNIGNVCEFGCTFCYVPAVTTKQKYVQDVLAMGMKIDDFSLYRTRENVLDYVKRDLAKIKASDHRTVFFCTTCDPCSNEEHTKTTAMAIRLIMESSQLQVRVLSKSELILGLAESLKEWRDRIVYSLSTGTCRPEISRAVEGSASPIRKRVVALHSLQDRGYRTFGMICPILPTDVKNTSELLDQVRPDRCEQVWAEAVNVRGKSLVKTQQHLKKDGLRDDASLLEEVMGDRAAWRKYCLELFFKLQSSLKSRGQLHKLRFLQYTTGQPQEFVSAFRLEQGGVRL